MSQKTKKESIAGQTIKTQYSKFLQASTPAMWKHILKPVPLSQYIKRWNIDKGPFHFSAGYSLKHWGIGISIEKTGFHEWECVIRLFAFFFECKIF